VAIIIIPARLASTRLPNKLLLAETGKSLLHHTIDRARESKLANKIIVASEDQGILDVVPSDIITALTPKCFSGSERMAWVTENCVMPDNIVVNLQGDEPELSGEHLDSLIQVLQDDSVVDVATLAAPANSLDYKSYSVVKTVLNHDGDAMYFSRCAIPYGAGSADNVWPLKHIGVYAYRREFLLALSSMEPTTLGSESLEQLQWLQSGFKIRVLERDIKTTGIDTIDEYQSFVQRVGKF